MTAPEVLIQYEGRLRELEASLVQAREQQRTLTALLAIVAFALLLGVHTLWPRAPIWWPALLLVPLAAAVLPRFLRLHRDESTTWRLRRVYQRAIRRLKGLWAGEGSEGAEFQDAGHPYARDLSIFGAGSLFELLCVARTAIGRRGLANYLLAAPVPEETQARQEAVRELRQRADLCEQLAVLGDFEAAESRWETFTDWLNAPPVPFNPTLRPVAALTSALVLIILLGGLLGLLSWTHTVICLVPFALFQSGAGLVCRDRVRRMMESLRAASLETRVLREGLQLLERQRFESAKLVRINERVRGASRSVRQLERLLNALHERNKEWFYPVSLLLMAATQLCMATEQWRIRYGTALRDWMEAWGEFEALNSLANYARENPNSTFPEFSAAEARFEAVALGHPLLPDETCVRNDVTLNAGTRFYVVSGSNMSGKSSLLRAIGLNGVLAAAGAPVRAQALRLSPLSVCASVSVVDSLLNGKSKFLAEVERVRQAIDLATGGRPVLFVIDEIFSGTNSRDRRAAAEAVVRTLVGRGAIGALSTHDISLTEIAGAPDLHGVNVHLGAKDGNDPMSFDYRLKPGITTETNALAIARMAGVPALNNS